MTIQYKHRYNYRYKHRHNIEPEVTQGSEPQILNTGARYDRPDLGCSCVSCFHKSQEIYWDKSWTLRSAAPNDHDSYAFEQVPSPTQQQTHR